MTTIPSGSWHLGAVSHRLGFGDLPQRGEEFFEATLSEAGHELELELGV